MVCDSCRYAAAYTPLLPCLAALATLPSIAPPSRPLSTLAPSSSSCSLLP